MKSQEVLPIEERIIPYMDDPDVDCLSDFMDKWGDLQTIVLLISEYHKALTQCESDLELAREYISKLNIIN